MNRIIQSVKLLSLIKKLRPYKFEKGLIRVGSARDGGYLLPNDLKDIQSCFSPGVGDNSQFELWCYNNGMGIYMADGSVDKPNLELDSSEYSFLKTFVGSRDDENLITLDTWVESNETDPNSDYLLQMDIEGGEYDCIMSTSDALMKRFRVMVIEFHDLERLWRPDFFAIANSVFSKILQTHRCIHIHPNNHEALNSQLGIDIPHVAEFTFIRRDRISSRKFERVFPHELDSDNSEVIEHMALPEVWHKKMGGFREIISSFIPS